MIQGSMGRRYARAFLEIAREQKKIEESLAELENFGRLLSGSHEFRVLMTDPAFESSEKKKALALLAEKIGGLSAATQNFLKLLIDRERMVIFPDILRSFRDQADEALGRARALVKVEDPLPDQAKDQIKQLLERITKKKVLLEVREKTGILGGMVVQIQDLVLDGSVKSALERIKEKMMAARVL